MFSAEEGEEGSGGEGIAISIPAGIAGDGSTDGSGGETTFIAMQTQDGGEDAGITTLESSEDVSESSNVAYCSDLMKLQNTTLIIIAPFL